MAETNTSPPPHSVASGNQSESDMPGLAPDPAGGDPDMQARFATRCDLQFSRQLHDSGPVYVVLDPIAFRTHRLHPLQYRILVELDQSQTAGANFTELIRKGVLAEDDREFYLSLLTNFRQSGLLKDPQADGRQLYERSRQLQQAKTRGKLVGFLFMQVPLVHPDRFLTKTLPWFRPFFSRAFAFLWGSGMLAAGYLLWTRPEDFSDPFNGLLANANIPFLWLAFVGLKIWHELGHGYACKLFGGYVPEMGTILIAGTPAAYVDASAAWSFPRRRQRLLVMCGGMYFESMIFILGIFVRAFSSDPMLRSCAYQLVMMAGLITVLFNANPLMKFDGYFILSELVGIQNLRPRADAIIRRSVKSVFLGLRDETSDDKPLTRLLLIVYGIAAAIYKFTLVISISVMIAMKFPVAGIGLAAFHILTTTGRAAMKLADWLLRSEATAPVRTRARILAGLVFVALPVSAAVIPIPTGVSVRGVVSAENEQSVNIMTEGRVARIHAVPGTNVEAGQVLMTLENPLLNHEVLVKEAELEEARTLLAMTAGQDPVRSAELQARHNSLQTTLTELNHRRQALQVAAPVSGTLLKLPGPDSIGRFFEAGTPVGSIASGNRQLSAWVNEGEFGSLNLRPGAEVRYRHTGRELSAASGQITSVLHSAEQRFTHSALTHLAGENIVIDPATGKPTDPVFRINIAPESDADEPVDFGSRVTIQLPRRYETPAGWAYRRCLRFVRSLLQA